MEEKAIYLRLGKNIRDARNAMGLTQAKLAVAIGLTRPSVTNIEKGSQKIKIHTLYRIADALNTEIVNLLPQSKIDIDESVWRVPPDINEEDQEWIQAVLSKVEKE